MLKKIFALLLVTIMLTGVIGCTPAAAPATDEAPATDATSAPVEATEASDPTMSGESVVLDYYWIGNGDTDQRDSVEKAINAYIEPLINATVKFHIIGWGDWDSKAITALQAGEKMDIIFTADWSRYMQETSEGLLTPLNDPDGPNGNLLEKYGQDILTTLNPAFITGTQVDGINYAVPTNKELTVPDGYMYNLTAAEEIGLTPEDVANFSSEADFEPWLVKYQEKYPDQYGMLTCGGWGFTQWIGLAAGLPGDVVSMKIAPDANGKFDETIYSTWETPQNKAFAELMYGYMKKGFINPDAALTTTDCNPVMNAGKFLFYQQPLKGSNIKTQELVNASGNPDLRMAEIYGQPKVNVTTHAGGSMLAIPKVSDYPVQAMKLLNLMHSDSTLVNMMLYGVKGTHWELQDDGRVNILNSAWYGAHAGAWTVGDTLLQAVSNKEDPKKNQMLIDYSNDSINHPSLGFRFRTEPVAAELTALSAVVDGMDRALRTGSVDPAVELPKYIQAMKDAGLDTVKAEIEKQYQEWQATKAK